MEQEIVKLLNKTFTLAMVLVAGILIFLVGQLAYQERSLQQQNANQITVSGEGKVYVKPDVAIISLGVTSQAPTVAEVTKANTDKMNSVIATVKELKVNEKDILSTNYSLTPVYETYTTPVVVPMMYPLNVSGETVKSATNIVGYKLEQNIQVKIRDFTTVGDIIVKTTTNGANLVGDLQFTIDNPEQFREQARAEAIKKAKVNAKNLSKESGVDLGKLINVYENYNSYPMMYNSVAKGMGESAPDAVSVPTIQPGQQEISLTVNLTYQVK